MGSKEDETESTGEPTVLDTEDEGNNGEDSAEEKFSLTEEGDAMKSEQVERSLAGPGADESEDESEEEEATPRRVAADAAEEEEEPAEEPEPQRRTRRSGPLTAETLLTDEILERARRADVKLRSQLTGKILISLDDGNYLFDWSKENVSAEKSDATSADCSIALSDANLLSIASGDLNPQIGMLSEKIVVNGDVGLAVYFFNLVAPR